MTPGGAGGASQENPVPFQVNASDKLAQFGTVAGPIWARFAIVTQANVWFVFSVKASFEPQVGVKRAFATLMVALVMVEPSTVTVPPTFTLPGMVALSAVRPLATVRLLPILMAPVAKLIL